jgi:hypothetical protein
LQLSNNKETALRASQEGSDVAHLCDTVVQGAAERTSTPASRECTAVALLLAAFASLAVVARTRTSSADPLQSKGALVVLGFFVTAAGSYRANIRRFDAERNWAADFFNSS